MEGTCRDRGRERDAREEGKDFRVTRKTIKLENKIANGNINVSLRNAKK